MLTVFTVIIAVLYLWLAFDAYVTPVSPDPEDNEEEVSHDL